MEHVVFFPAHDGSPAFRRLVSLEDAARFVEHLRNVEGVDHVSVHALTEVPLAFKAYYRVEMPGQEGVESQPVVEAAPVEGVAPVADPVAQLPVPQLADDLSVAVALPQQEQPTEPAQASLGFFSRG